MDVFALRCQLEQDRTAYLESYVRLDARRCVDSADRERRASPPWLGASRPTLRPLGLTTGRASSATAPRE